MILFIPFPRQHVRTLIVAATALAVFLCIVAMVISFKRPVRPNVILISIDSLRPDRMGVYGYERATTPHIDAWAKDAIIFDNYFSSAFLTPISETGVHTGKYPFTNGVINFESPLSPGTRMIAEIFQDNGWQTAAFGSSPEFERQVLKQNYVRGFDVYTHEDTKGEWNGRHISPMPRALDWIKNKRDPEKPFFVWINVSSVHWPYGLDEPEYFADRPYEGLLKIPADYYKETHQVNATFNHRYGLMYKGSQYKDKQAVKNDITQDLKYINDRYDDAVRSTDQDLKELLEYLKTRAMRNTIVIVQSEHGEELGERGFIAHYDVNDYTTHVPLLIRVPGMESRRVDALISAVDVAPTLLDIVGLSAEKTGMDGISMHPYLTGLSDTEREEVYLSRTPMWERILSAFEPWLGPFVEYDDKNPVYDTAVRTKNWKLIHRLSRDIMTKYSWYRHVTGDLIYQPEYQLYDLKNDPRELTDVYEVHKGEKVIRDLREKLSTWETEMQEKMPRNTTPSIIQPYF